MVQAAAKSLFKQLEDSAAPVLPLHFLMQLRQNYPQFAEQAPTTGAYKQQDAEECWSQLLYTLNERLQVGHLLKCAMLMCAVQACLPMPR